MPALFESFSLTVTLDVTVVPIQTILHFSLVGESILDNVLQTITAQTTCVLMSSSKKNTILVDTLHNFWWETLFIHWGLEWYTFTLGESPMQCTCHYSSDHLGPSMLRPCSSSLSLVGSRKIKLGFISLCVRLLSSHSWVPLNSPAWCIGGGVLDCGLSELDWGVNPFSYRGYLWRHLPLLMPYC